MRAYCTLTSKRPDVRFWCLKRRKLWLCAKKTVEKIGQIKHAFARKRVFFEEKKNSSGKKVWEYEKTKKRFRMWNGVRMVKVFKRNKICLTDIHGWFAISCIWTSFENMILNKRWNCCLSWWEQNNFYE